MQEESKQSDLAEEMTQTKLPEHIISTSPIMQTPLNEEKNLKRDREEATPSGKAISKTYIKTQRLNSFFEKEFIEETVGATSTER